MDVLQRLMFVLLSGPSSWDWDFRFSWQTQVNYLAAMVTPMDAGYDPEPGIERVLIHRSALFEMIATGAFDHALHLGDLTLGLAKRGRDMLGIT
ncbi:MAG: hypothetical protein ACLQBD_20470 [Syntrophobacteraceae bacterium]